jgi:hypothetical protein
MRLFSPGDGAKECRVSVPQFLYAAKTRGIKPVQRAGRIRLFSEEQLPAIRAALKEVERNSVYNPERRAYGPGGVMR